MDNDTVKNMQKDDLLLLDEADWHLLDERSVPPQCLGVIAMSATTVGKKNANEEYRLKELGFEMIPSLIEGDFDPDKDVKETPAEEVLGDSSDNMAVVVLCIDEDIEQYQKIAK